MLSSRIVLAGTDGTVPPTWQVGEIRSTQCDHPMNKRSILAGVVLLCAHLAAAASCDTVPQRLSTLVSSDQRIREEGVAQGRDGKASESEKQALQLRWRDIDAENLKQFKDIIRACGWPRQATASHDAWLLAQHADSDSAFQRQAKDLLEAAVKAGVGAGADLAYLADRIATAERRPQEYGTQFTQAGRCDLQLQPVDDIALVNARRLAVGLGSVEDYLAQGRKLFLPADCAGAGQ